MCFAQFNLNNNGEIIRPSTNPCCQNIPHTGVRKGLKTNGHLIHSINLKVFFGSTIGYKNWYIKETVKGGRVVHIKIHTAFYVSKIPFPLPLIITVVFNQFLIAHTLFLDC